MTLGSRPLPSLETFRLCQLADAPPLSFSNWNVSPILSLGLGTGLSVAMKTVLGSCGAVVMRHGMNAWLPLTVGSGPKVGHVAPASLDRKKPLSPQVSICRLPPFGRTLTSQKRPPAGIVL